MVTQKQWKDFNKYRDVCYQGVVESESYKGLAKRILETPLALSNDLILLQDRLLAQVPPKTIEACLDWLVYQKK